MSPEPTQPMLGADGEPCPACGSPLAADPRYCLACGERRPTARLAFLDALRGETELVPYGRALTAGIAPAGYGAYAPPPGAGLNARLRESSGLLALVGVLLVALLIGV